MNFTLSKNLFGKNGEEAYKKIVDEGTPITPKEIIPPTEEVLEGFIFVPSLGFCVSRERFYHGKNWRECQEILHNAGEKMLTLSEFVKFLKYTRESNPDIFEDITAVRDPYRAEWLDADFKSEGKNLFVYYHVFENGKIISKKEKLDSNTLMEKKTPGINLESWLADPTKQGFPKSNCPDGDLYYWFPLSDNDSVAWFGADSDRSGLSCGRYPSNRYSHLGVRRCCRSLLDGGEK